MKKVPLYKNGPTVSAVGYGAMSFSNFYGPTTREQSFAILDRCRDIDVNHLDTAHMYGWGESENTIGEYLKANPSTQDFFKIATKGGIWDRDRAENDGFGSSNSRATFERHLDESLQRLGLDCVELYYVHRLDNRYAIEETAEIMASFVKAGKIKAYGLSEVAPATLRRAHAIHPVGAVQSEYSLWTRLPELGIIQTCKELDVTFVPFSPVGRGMLTDSPRRVEGNADAPFLSKNPRFVEPNLTANLKWTDTFRNHAADKGVATATLAVAWTIAKWDHMLSIPGTRSVEHFNEVAAAGKMKLSTDEIAEIEKILPVGFAHGDRYSAAQWTTQDIYC